MTFTVPFELAGALFPDATLVVSATGEICWANPAFCATFGWTPAELVGRSALPLLSPEEDVRTYLRRCAAVRALVPGAMSVRHADGSLVECRAEGGLLRAGNGDAPALVLLRATPRNGGPTRFAALTQKVDELSVEVGRRRIAETRLAAALEEQHALRDRLSVLTEAAGALFAALSEDAVITGIGELARRLFSADAYAVWKLDADTGTWSALWTHELSDRFVAAIEGWSGGGRPDLPLPEALFVTDYNTVPLLRDRRETYKAEGIESLIIVPLSMTVGAQGTVVAYYRRRTTFDESDARVAKALGKLGSSALATAVLCENERRSRAFSELAEGRAAFLARAGAALASSLDYEETLRAVAMLAVPEIADWCGVDVLTEQGDVKQIAAAHVNPDKVRFVRALRERYPPDPSSPYGVHAVIRTGAPVLLSEITDDLVRASARDDRDVSMIRELGLASYMCVPLVTRGRAIGALTFAAAESGRRYTPADLRFAEAVASRAALAVDNARAYGELRRANRLKDDFLATLSHELRTPLNAVLGYTSMLRSGAIAPEKQGAALESVERNAQALAQLVEDVLDISRIEAGKIRLNVQPVAMASVIEGALATVAPAAAAKRIAIDVAIAPGLPPIQADPDRLQQVAWNILANAVKFTPQGGRVAVRLEIAASCAELTISDSGPGIPASFLPNVFEPFRQAETQTSREHGGLGLGLAIARHLVEMHGGTIQAFSGGPEPGATFRVRLPLTVPGAPEDAG